MPDPWPNANADDEQALLMGDLDSGTSGRAAPSAPERWEARPSRRKRFSAIFALMVVVTPFLFLLWMTSWVAYPYSNSTTITTVHDSFVLDSKFDWHAPPAIRVYYWTVSAVPMSSESSGNRTRVVVNGRSPGPVIEANAHDRIHVYVTNGLKDQGTSIHWHGLPLPETPFYDGAAGISQCPIPPGKTLLYNFTVGDWTGTTWWHGHTGMQHTDGLYGPIIVHSPQDHNTAQTNYTAEHVLTFADILDTPADELLPTYLSSHDMETVPEPVPDRVAINGLGGGPHHDKTRRLSTGSATPIHAARTPQETHGVEDNPGYPNTNTSSDDQRENKYFEIQVEQGRTCAVLLLFVLFCDGQCISDDYSRTRLRLIHAGTFAPLRISVDHHTLTLIEADGSPVEPVKVRDLVLQPAQRYSVLIARERGDKEDGVDAFWVRAVMVEDKFAYDNPTRHPEARAILRYTPSPSSASTATSTSTASATLPTTLPGPYRTVEAEWYALPHFDEWALKPPSTDAARRPIPHNNNINAHTIPFIFSIQRTHELNWRSFINGTSWEVPENGEASGVGDLVGVYSRVGREAEVKVWPGDQLVATLQYNQTVDFIITNLDDGDHPFHLHGYAPWILGSGRGRYKPATSAANLDLKTPLRRDTFTVPSRGWAVIRILADNPGYWAFHCHIVWHMMGGGLFQLAIPLPASDGGAVALPEAIVEQCRSWAKPKSL
ncbi:multicopper oxidase [Favolaschia claudopus]|uniref:Multicopper oxidase n=1 Tax=Favolaschia claudopus TaxID=2862362 RepID=A0AAW0A8L3_9AGAR